MNSDPFKNTKTGDPHSRVLWQGKSDFNGTVRCFEERGYRYIQTIFKSRFPTTQTGVKISNPLISKFKLYPAGLFISLGYQEKDPSDSRIILIGCAGGYVINYLDHYHPGVDLHPIEIDPVMVQLATDYFDVKTPITVDDGAAFINEHPPSRDVDIVMLDAFNGMYIPDVFNQDIFYDNLKKNVLTRDGILAVNIVENDSTPDLVNRIKSHFPQVDEFYQGGNLVLIACCTPRSKEDVLLWSTKHQSAHKYVYNLNEMRKRYRRVDKPKPGSLFK